MPAYRPAWLTTVTDTARAAGDGLYACQWIESMCCITKDSVGGRAGETLKLRDWQVDIVCDLLARNPDTGRYLHRESLLSVCPGRMASHSSCQRLPCSVCLKGL